MKDNKFWPKLDELIDCNKLIIDRPKGSHHPIHKDIIYPFDYGYIEGTKSGDGDCVDVWVGTLSSKKVSAIICTFDIEKLDFEMKILIGCTYEDCQIILDVHNDGGQYGALVQRPNGV